MPGLGRCREMQEMQQPNAPCRQILRPPPPPHMPARTMNPSSRGFGALESEKSDFQTSGVALVGTCSWEGRGRVFGAPTAYAPRWRLRLRPFPLLLLLLPLDLASFGVSATASSTRSLRFLPEEQGGIGLCVCPLTTLTVPGSKECALWQIAESVEAHNGYIAPAIPGCQSKEQPNCLRHPHYYCTVHYCNKMMRNFAHDEQPDVAFFLRRAHPTLLGAVVGKKHPQPEKFPSTLRTREACPREMDRKAREKTRGRKKRLGRGRRGRRQADSLVWHCDTHRHPSALAPVLFPSCNDVTQGGPGGVHTSQVASLVGCMP